MSFLFVLCANALLLFSTNCFSKTNNWSHDATPKEIEAARSKNQSLRKQSQTPKKKPDYQPVHDTADFAYVLMSSRDNGDSEVLNIRRQIAMNLPESVKLVLLTSKGMEVSVLSKYEAWIPRSRIILAVDEDGYESNGFWARDSFPVPVWNEATREASLVALDYYRSFSSQEEIAQSVSSKLYRFNQVFVGGNLLADEDGHCFTVDSYRMFDLTADEIGEFYGCLGVTVLKHVAGLGDVDEVMKPLSNRRILTNQPSYKPVFENLGYEVIMMPKLASKYRTYLNSLIVGDTVFMPAYGGVQDQEAITIYQELGYRVIALKSNSLSDYQHGSIHCQTMAYPQMSEELVLRSLGL
jgi:hypothetical protein